MAHAVIAKLTGNTAKNVVANAAAATYGAVAADEIAIVVGSNITGRLKGTTVREHLKELARVITSKPRPAPAAGSLGVYALAPAGRADLHTYSAELEATAIDEDELAIVVGATLAASLARSGLIVTAIDACLIRYWDDVGRKA